MTSEHRVRPAENKKTRSSLSRKQYIYINFSIPLFMFNYTEAVENTVNSRDTRGEILLYSYWSKLISLKKKRVL